VLATKQKKDVGSDGALLGLIVKFLGLLLQLVEATLGIEVDGILSDLALYKGTH
jgi:hypothetical protein